MSQKLCRDCKHAIPTGIISSAILVVSRYEYAKCALAKRPSDVVTGISKGYSYCSTERAINSMYSKTCGPEGRFFEPKEKK